MFQHMNTTLPIIAIIISLISLGVAIYALRRNIKIQNVDFGPYLQFEGECIKFGSPKRPNFKYYTEIANKGLKPISVANVWMRYGDPRNQSSQRHSILNSFALSPGEKRVVEFNCNQDELMKILKQLYLSECVFTLEVEYKDLSKQVRNETRELGGYSYMNGEIGVGFHCQGEMLS